MRHIIPAVLPKRYREIEDAVEKVKGAVPTVQIDVVDGQFAPNKTWLFNGKDEEVLGEFEREERGLPLWQEMNYELDVMVRDPLSHIETLLMLGPSKIIFHFESFRPEEMLHYFETVPEIIKETVKFGMAIGIGTPPEDIAAFIPYIESIQCMGIENAGFQGEPFDVRAIAQIKRAKALYPEKTISVDGGVTKTTLPLLLEAGATSFVIGSAIFGSDDPRGTIKALEKLCTATIAPEN